MSETLIKLKNGDFGRVESINAGKSATRRLYEMGFNSGAQLKIIKNDSGPLIIGLAGNKVAIGRGLAEKIKVEI